VELQSIAPVLLWSPVLRPGQGIRLSESRQCLPRQFAEPSQITVHDCFAFRVRLEPALAMAEQLLNLVLPDPVAFVRIEHRDQNVEMGKQVLQRDLLCDLDGVIRAFTTQETSRRADGALWSHDS
jgi:hypothetical protein